MKGNPKQIL